MWITPDGHKPDDYILPDKPVDFCVKGSAFEQKNVGIEIETGKWYLTASGTLTKIVMHTKSMYKETTTYIDIYDRSYNYMGKCGTSIKKAEPHLDIIAEIPDKLRYYLLNSVNSYYNSPVAHSLMDMDYNIEVKGE